MSRIGLLRKVGIGALAALVVVGSVAASTTGAEARWRGHYYHHHHHHRGIGPGIAAGIIGGIAAATLAAPYYGGYYAYGPCWTERQEVIDPWGRVYYRPVRVCR